MRLLPKYEIDKKRAEEERQRMEEGMKIANRVDLLRETLVSEEVSFEKYRVDTLKEIQSEIQIKIVERDALLDEVSQLERQKIIAQAPIDLAEEWRKVREDQSIILKDKDEIGSRELAVMSNEISIFTRDRDLSKREEKVKNRENLSEGYFAESKTSYENAKKVQKEAEKAKNDAENEIKQRFLLVKQKENEILEAESQLISQRKDIDAQNQQIAKDKLWLIDQRKTLERAFNRLKK